jgi:hypothetical protein
MLKRYADVTGIVTPGDLVTPPASPALYQMLNVEWGMVGTVTGGSTLFGAGCGTVGDNHPINIEMPPSLRPTKIRLVSHGLLDNHRAGHACVADRCERWFNRIAQRSSWCVNRRMGDRPTRCAESGSPHPRACARIVQCARGARPLV